MNDLQTVIQRVKADMKKGYVFVHMTATQLEILLDGLEELEKERDELQKRVEWLEERNILLLDELDAADIPDPTRPRFRMDANGNLTRFEEKE